MKESINMYQVIVTDKKNGCCELIRNLRSIIYANSDLNEMRNKINEYEIRQNKFLNYLWSNENVINGMKSKNNGILNKYQTLESKWVSICNELDEILKTKNNH